MSVPVVDLQLPLTQVADQIDQACCEIGFFAVTNHGIPQPIINDAWHATAEFFSLPAAQKLNAQHQDTNHPYGYFPAGREALAASVGIETPPDLKESFNLAPPRHHHDPSGLFGGVERIWPAKPTGFRSAWTLYYDSMAELSGRILTIFGAALGADPTVFDGSVDQHLSALRGLNYPPLDHHAEDRQIRAGQHTDYGTLTILLPGSGTGGLEILQKDNTWLPVQPIEGAFIVNLGDMMERWTNDRWRSTLHRVALPSAQEAAVERRQSLAFFHQPNWTATISAIPTCVSAEKPALHEPVQAGPWLQKKFNAASASDQEDRQSE